jgi:16S rRNA (guanine966-N2)-methyltransferase
VRPTSDRVREALFSTLGSIADLSDARVLDLYAGSGSLGLEALSRGANEAVFVEANNKRVDALKRFLGELGEESSSALPRKVASYLQQEFAAPVFDLVFADPPYSEHPGNSLMEWLLESGAVVVGAWLVIESRSDLELQAQIVSGQRGFVLEKSKTYGDTKLWYYQYSEIVSDAKTEHSDE